MYFRGGFGRFEFERNDGAYERAGHGRHEADPATCAYVPVLHASENVAPRSPAQTDGLLIER